MQWSHRSGPYSTAYPLRHSSSQAAASGIQYTCIHHKTCIMRGIPLSIPLSLISLSLTPTLPHLGMLKCSLHCYSTVYLYTIKKERRCNIGNHRTVPVVSRTIHSVFDPGMQTVSYTLQLLLLPCRVQCVHVDIYIM